MPEYNYRYIAQITIEAETPLAVSNGENDLICDLLVATDANGIPMIPGTSLCGVLRSSLNDTHTPGTIADIFGGQKPGSDEGAGSRLIISSAHIIDEDGKTVIEGLHIKKSHYLQYLEKLPVRQHCKINHRGAADVAAYGKFDNQILLKGVRFKFEIELLGSEADKSDWNAILSQFSRRSFRIGGGTRKGYGKLKVIEIRERCFDLEKDLDDYLKKTSSLNCQIEVAPKTVLGNPMADDYWIIYELNVSPDDFWLFGSGFPDEDVDMTPVYENTVDWKTGRPVFSKKMILIPASSIKGAISHRTAFHYNKLSGNFADKLPTGRAQDDFVGEKNEAVKSLFGYAKDSKKESAGEDGQRGNVIMSDLFVHDENKTKILNHVSIDRFTGGAIDGALFDEKVLSQKSELKVELIVNKKAFAIENIKKAFESALSDICTGILPLGGGVMRGHGCFSGNWVKHER
jgi:CRISPR/Cas system CSM-associated protein Csm3 (group 7 of RAMP superfamily)